MEKGSFLCIKKFFQKREVYIESRILKKEKEYEKRI